MKIDAKVQSISKLKDYFFLVPDYQREYVWKPDDEVEQFLIDIVHIPADTRSAFPVISVQSPVSIQCCWQS